jgi:hypothetical protein
MPGPVPRTRLYDLVAIDRALDKLSGLAADNDNNELDVWLQGNGHAG